MQTYKGFKRDEKKDQPGQKVSCVAPIDVFSIYPPNADTVYYECAVEDYTPIKNTGVVISSWLVQNAVCRVKKLAERQRKYVNVFSKNDYEIAYAEDRGAMTTGSDALAMTSQKDSHAVTISRNSPAITGGEFSNAVTTGNNSPAMTVKMTAHAVTVGDHSPAITAGEYSHSVATGVGSHSVAVGMTSYTASKKGRAVAVEDYSFAEAISAGAVAVGLGQRCRVRGVLGSTISCAWYKNDKLMGIKTEEITKNSLVKPGVWYQVDDQGEWEEVE